MKKILILLLLLIPIVYAQEIIISLPRNDYAVFETFQAEVFINVTPVNEITVSNFVLKDNLNNKIPTALFLNKISRNLYFVYFNLPNLTSGRYNFNVVDIRYIEKNLKQISASKSFNLQNINLSDEVLLTSISINPGIITNRDAKLEIKNNFNELNLTIEAPDYLNIPNKATLNKILTYNIKIPENISKDNIKIIYNEKFYIIPIFLGEIQEEQKLEIELLLKPPRNSIIFLNSTLGTSFPEKIKINKDSSPQSPLYILNKWDFTIRNITFLITGNLNEIIRLNLSNVDEIKPNETLKQYIWVNEKKNPSLINYSGNILVLQNQDVLGILPLKIEFIEKIKPVEAKVNEIVKNKTIEIINETIIPKVEEKKSNLALIIIAIIILVIILVLIFLATRKKEREPFEEFLHRKS